MTLGTAGRALAALLVMSSACSDKLAISAVPSTPQGAYVLTTVAGKGVPYTVTSDGDYRQELSSGSLELGSDGLFVRRWTVSDFEADVLLGSYPDSSRGTWTRSDNTLALFDAFSQTTTGASWAGNTVTLVGSEHGVALSMVYSR